VALGEMRGNKEEHSLHFEGIGIIIMITGQVLLLLVVGLEVIMAHLHQEKGEDGMIQK
jgi:hypothetical protein